MKKFLAICAALAFVLTLGAATIPTDQISTLFLRTVVTDTIIACSEDTACKYHEDSNKWIASVVTVVGMIEEDSVGLTKAIEQSKKQPASQPSEKK